jgi:hypothetical protein
MVNIENLNDSLKEINIAKESINSSLNLNNWLFGISVGLFALIYFDTDKALLQSNNCLKIYFICLVCIAMLNCIFFGVVKLKFHATELNLNLKEGELRKYVITCKLDNTALDEIKPKFMDKMESWFEAYYKYTKTIKYLNFGILITVLTVIAATIYLILLII